VERLTAPASAVWQRRAARGLRRRGLRPGDRVAVVLPGSGASISLVLGALRSGVVAVPLDPSLTPSERGPLLADADPALVVDDAAILAELIDDPAELDLAPLPRARPMHYTSGTTGRPKGVWSGLLDDAAAAALVAEEQSMWGFAADDVHLVSSPLHHSAPLRFAMGTLLAGGTVVLPGRFAAPRWAAAVAEHRPSTTFVVPAHLARLLAHGLPSTASFRLVAHAGAPCPPPVKAATVAAFPEGSVWEFYGATEGQVTACSTAEWRERPGTVGRARPGRTVTADPDGRLWVHVPDYARFSYWRDDDRTSAAWRGDAFTVGDLGRLDNDGYVFLDGRREDLVISGGVNVYPAEVEAALAACPGVGEVAVFGIPHPGWGQQVCLAVVGDVPRDTLDAFAREHLAPAKRPKRVVRIGALPRTASGKIRRLDLPALTAALPEA
jgi:long-chain acyl-CoA synthetase